LTDTGNNKEHDTSWAGGAQAGYNVQWHCTVVGVQADWSWTNAKADNLYRNAPFANGDSLDYQSHEKRFGTLRARSGIVVDNLLLYLTGGLAWANFHRDLAYSPDLPPLPGRVQYFNSSATKRGFALGVGTEWAWLQNWSITSEILYLAFDKDNQAFTCTIATIGCGPTTQARTHLWPYEFKDSQWVARIGLNYRFSGAVAASY
jgi:opacity protein-like surface antigen